MNSSQKKAKTARMAGEVLEAVATAAGLLNRVVDEIKTFDADFEQRAAEAAQWEDERARLNNELQKLARMQAATQAEAEKAIMAMKAASDAARNASARPLNHSAINSEIERIETSLKDIGALLEDPEAELSTIIRKNAERAELESYLKGIRFALQPGNPK